MNFYDKYKAVREHDDRCGLFVQKDAQQRTVDLQSPVVFDEAELPELVHEKTHTWPGRPDHLRKRLLADLRGDLLRLSFLAEICQQEKDAGQALFAGIEQVVDEVSLDPAVAGQQVRREHLGKVGLAWRTRTISAFSMPKDGSVGHRDRRRQAQGLRDQAAFAEKVSSPNSPTTASRPCPLVTAILILPWTTWKTASAASPCA